MIVTCTFVPAAGHGPSRTQVEVFVAACEVCGFSAVSHYEHDAVAIERHQTKSLKFKADKTNGKTSGAA